MRSSAVGLVLGASLLAVFAMGACSGGGDGEAATGPDDASSAEGGPGGGDGAGSGDGGGDDATSDGAPGDAADGGDADASTGPPGVQLIGRFVSDGTGDRAAFPSSRIVARFQAIADGTNAVVKLSQTNGFSGGPSYFNVVVDGVVQATPIAVTGASADYTVATGLAIGTHTVEVEKRTEPNLGVVRFEGVTFTKGGVLLAPPPRKTRRIEFLSDSTIDGFGIEGDRTGGASFCGAGLAPPQFHNARKSMAAVAAATLGAEHFLVAYSGKGITRNESAGDTLLFPTLYDRALPDSAASTWNRASWIPDAVVISVGGVDFDGLTAAPAGFSTAYGALVDKIRASYPAAYIFMTVWSQIKDDVVATRTAMVSTLQSIAGTRDAKILVYAFPTANVDADETGCQYHGNVAHHAAMAAELVKKIKATIPGW